MKLKKTLNQKILIKIDKLTEDSRGGIFIHTETKNPYSVGEVVLVSDEITSVEVGDKVMFSKFAGTGFKEDNLSSSSDEYKIVSESDLLGIVDVNS